MDSGSAKERIVTVLVRPNPLGPGEVENARDFRARTELERLLGSRLCKTASVVCIQVSDATEPRDADVFIVRVQGEAGPPGINGPQGRDGEQGTTGPVGPRGRDGEPGPAGPAGRDGEQGPAGPAGRDGEQGPAGPAGRDGELGPVGPQGCDGELGPVGPQGRDGEQGPAGPAGRDGERGRVGPQGRDGEQGPAGLQGRDGEQGPAGPPGRDGEQGPAGPPGECRCYNNHLDSSSAAERIRTAAPDELSTTKVETGTRLCESATNCVTASRAASVIIVSPYKTGCGFLGSGGNLPVALATMVKDESVILLPVFGSDTELTAAEGGAVCVSGNVTFVAERRCVAHVAVVRNSGSDRMVVARGPDVPCAASSVMSLSLSGQFLVASGDRISFSVMVPRLSAEPTTAPTAAAVGVPTVPKRGRRAAQPAQIAPSSPPQPLQLDDFGDGTDPLFAATFSYTIISR